MNEKLTIGRVTFGQGSGIHPMNKPANDQALIQKILQLEKELTLERKRLDWLDKHCSFVADYDYNLGPFAVGELRKLADAGIAVDSEGK